MLASSYLHIKVTVTFLLVLQYFNVFHVYKFQKRIIQELLLRWVMWPMGLLFSSSIQRKSLISTIQPQMFLFVLSFIIICLNIFFLQSGDFFKKPNLKVYFITHNLMLLLFKQYHIYGGFFLKIDGENDNDSFDITAVDTLIRWHRLGFLLLILLT